MTLGLSRRSIELVTADHQLGKFEGRGVYPVRGRGDQAMPTDQQHWVGTWTMAPAPAETGAFNNQTLRMTIRASPQRFDRARRPTELHVILRSSRTTAWRDGSAACPRLLR